MEPSIDELWSLETCTYRFLSLHLSTYSYIYARVHIYAYIYTHQNYCRTESILKAKYLTRHLNNLG